MKYYLAIDVGASVGRHIVGWMERGELKTREVYRFPNRVTEAGGRLTWDVDVLFAHVKDGILRARAIFGKLESLSIDAWGMDYVLFRQDGELRPCYAYCDERVEAAVEQVHELLAPSELYRRTGRQFRPFHTIYQLYADKLAGRLTGATDFLMIPEYLMYRLCGVKAREYTAATTTGMVSAATGAFDAGIIERLGLPERLFPTLQPPGTVIGTYGGSRVVLCATHDSASAVEGIAMEGSEPYLSSGTWSLLGVKTEKPILSASSEASGYSNEGGVGYNRYQKSIMGTWLIDRLRAELCPDKTPDEIVREAEKNTFYEIVNVNAPAFLAPESMKAAFDGALRMKPRTDADYFRCAYRSLAVSYQAAVNELEKNTRRSYRRLYVVGGGAKNRFLNRLTAEATGKEIIALPVEAAALGNLKLQMKAAGEA